MFRSLTLRGVRSTTALLGSGLRTSRPAAHKPKEEPVAVPDAAIQEIIADVEEDTTPTEGTHVLPQKVLNELLETMIAGQKSFLLGSDSKKKGDTPEGTFYDVVNSSYEQRMVDERRKEAEAYVEKRRAVYEKRLNEETEEFRRERRAVHEALQRVEVDQYKKTLLSDVREFTVVRQQECEERLRSDTKMYYRALLSHSAKHERKFRYDALEKNLELEVDALAEDLEPVKHIMDFGTDEKGNGNDITDEEIRQYVEKRLNFYEHSLQEELQHYTQRRKRFYEDLIQARSIRHAAKVRMDTAQFKQKRSTYYANRAEADGTWMEKRFMEHYNNCFLQCYAREAWLSHRSAAKNTENKAFDDLSTITATGLEAKLPLAKLLDIYEKETVAEVSRESFLGAARRIAKEGPREPVKAAPVPEIDEAVEEEVEEEVYEDEEGVEEEEEEEK